MATFHGDLRKILNYVNVLALIAVGAYVWTDYNRKHPAPPKPSDSYVLGPIPPAAAQQLITGRVIGVTDGDTVTVRRREHSIQDPPGGHQRPRE